ncbi:MAG TPA: LLM class flavin-dependent oxidoreductase [Candidatus Binataceae bacterium]|nr:LLM class flavin-dependent oxidoreductase [Candidatus Binataceae bacterium]
MEFGITLDNLELAQVLETARMAEDVGFDLILFADHFVHEGAGGQGINPRRYNYDPMLLAATVAHATRRLRIGHLVLCNLFRHPALVARSLATLDQISGGRAVAGLGTGWMESEFRMIGIPFPPIDERLAMLDEALTAIRGLWTQERTSLAGRFYTLRDAVLFPKPLSQPHPPIIVGGSGRGLLRTAAKHADWVNIILELGSVGRFTPQEVRRATDGSMRAKIEFVRQEVRRLGRAPDAVRFSNVIFNWKLTDSQAETRQALITMAGGLGMDPEAVRYAPTNLIGTVEESIAELKRRVEIWGVTQIVFPGGFRGPVIPEHFRKLYEQVLAHV